jgi:hypothetical protein
LADPPQARRAEGRAPLFGLGKKGERLSSDACGVGSSARSRGPGPGAQFRLLPVGGGAGQRLGGMPSLVNSPQVPGPGMGLGDRGVGKDGGEGCCLLLVGAGERGGERDGKDGAR